MATIQPIGLAVHAKANTGRLHLHGTVAANDNQLERVRRRSASLFRRRETHQTSASQSLPSSPQPRPHECIQRPPNDRRDRIGRAATARLFRYDPATVVAGDDQATCRLRRQRARPSKLKHPAIRPGMPAPAIGPGTPNGVGTSGFVRPTAPVQLPVHGVGMKTSRAA